jgi:hypothetical protein
MERKQSHGARSSRKQFWTVTLPVWIGALAAVAGVIVAIIFGLRAVGVIGGAGPKNAGSPSSNSKAVTVYDSVNKGAWLRTSPDQGTIPSQIHRPSNAILWFPNHSRIYPVCDQTGATYVVKYVTRTEHWNWWARLRGGGWIPTAVVSNVHQNGQFPYGLC